MAYGENMVSVVQEHLLIVTEGGRNNRNAVNCMIIVGASHVRKNWLLSFHNENSFAMK